MVLTKFVDARPEILLGFCVEDFGGSRPAIERRFAKQQLRPPRHVFITPDDDPDRYGLTVIPERREVVNGGFERIVLAVPNR